MSTEKKTLRRKIKSCLSSLSPSTVTSQSTTAQNLILELPQYKQARSLSIYLSMPSSEAQTDLLVDHALASAKRVFVPYIYNLPQAVDGLEERKRKAMAMLRLASVAEYEGLQRDAWGIPSLSSEGIGERENAIGGKGLEGSEGDAEAGLDLVVVPGVAFDAQMRRLGHGAGFYDRYLMNFCGGGRSKPFLVGLCLAEQFLDSEQEIPTTEWDWKVDAIAVGDGRLITLEHA